MCQSLSQTCAEAYFRANRRTFNCWAHYAGSSRKDSFLSPRLFRALVYAFSCRGIPVGRTQLKKLLLVALLAAMPSVVFAAQAPQSGSTDTQAAPDTGASASTSRHSRQHHKRSRNSHRKARHHHTTKQHSTPQ